MVSGAQVKQKIAKANHMLSALGSSHRILILYLVSRDPLKPKELAQQLHMPETAVAHHIKYLHERGWIQKEKYGKLVLYSLSIAMVKKLRVVLEDIFHQPLSEK